MCSYHTSNENNEYDMGEANHGIRSTETWVYEGDDEKHKRHKRKCCVQCPNSHVVDGKLVKFHRATKYYCPACNVFLHPECFATYHREKGFDIVLIDDVETFVTPLERER